jgi:hypothetical protein
VHVDGDPRDRDVEAARADAEAALRELKAAVFDVAATQARRALEVAAIVFGLTLAFVVPEGSITTAELWFLGTAIGLLGGSIVVGLVVVVEVAAVMTQIQHASHQVSATGWVVPHRLAHAAVVLCLVGIAALTVFALLRLPSAT